MDETDYLIKCLNIDCKTKPSQIPKTKSKLGDQFKLNLPYLCNETTSMYEDKNPIMHKPIKLKLNNVSKLFNLKKEKFHINTINSQSKERKEIEVNNYSSDDTDNFYYNRNNFKDRKIIEQYNRFNNNNQLLPYFKQILHYSNNGSLQPTSKKILYDTKETRFRYLNFRFLVKDLEQHIKAPLDLGYYYNIISNNDSNTRLIRNTLEDNGFKDILKIENCPDKNLNNTITNLSQKRISSANLIWCSNFTKRNIYQMLSKYQKINHFPKSNEITRKDKLYINVSKLLNYIQSNGSDVFIPLSFILPNESKHLIELMEKDESCIWIIKPVSSSQGKGIIVTNKISEV